MNLWNGCNVATVGHKSVGTAIFSSTRGHKGGSLHPICFQLRWFRGYFIIVSMIYSQSIWIRLWQHTCNTQVGGTIWQIRFNDLHTCLRAYDKPARSVYERLWVFCRDNLFHWHTNHYVCHPIIRSLGASGVHGGSDSIFRTVRLNQSLQDSVNMPDWSCDLQKMSQLFILFCFMNSNIYFLFLVNVC